MSFVRRWSLGLAVAAASVSLALAAVQKPAQKPAPSKEARDDGENIELKPLVDVQQLMENVINPAFEGVKEGLGEKPSDRQAWKKLHASSIVIGESGNLLVFRKPEEAGTRDWNLLSTGMRDAAEGLVKATKSRDDMAAIRAYRSVVTACNKCHDKFGEDGEPKIEP